MKKIIKMIVMLLLLTTFITNTALSENPLDSNWRDFVYDKQAWELGPATCIITGNDNIIVGCSHSSRTYEWNDTCDITIFNYIAQLDDSLWIPLGSNDTVGIKGYFAWINDMIIIDSLLYVGGIFDSAGYIESQSIAVWNTNSKTWNSVGNGINGVVRSFANDGQILFVAGYFDTAGTTQVNNIASWDGTFWSDIGGGTDGIINSIIMSDEKLILGGEFENIYTSSSTFTVNNLAVLDITSSTWSTLGDGVNGIVNKICVIDSNVYVAGFFNEAYTSSSTISVNNIAEWNGNSWDSLQCGVNGLIDDMMNFNNELIIVGNFTNIGDDTVNNIAKWDGNSWSGFGSGADGRILCVATKGDSILIGGVFQFTADLLAENIGLWYVPPPPLEPYGPNGDNDKSDISLNLNIYPNPTNNELTIEFYLIEKDIVNIEFYDLLGNEIFNIANIQSDKSWNKKIINMNKFTSGSYIIKLTTSNESISKKFIISR